MKNFIFKSEADFHKIVFNKLDMVLTEQRHARQDLTTIIRLITGIKIEKDLQKQVDEYFDEDSEHIPEESHDKHDLD